MSCPAALLTPSSFYSPHTISPLSLLPFVVCNFDVDMCTFSNTGDNSWKRQHGPTPSVGTGPSGDHTSGNGYYVYTEVSKEEVIGMNSAPTLNFTHN